MQNTLSTYIDRIVDLIINPLIGLLFAAALVMFLWGASKLILKGGDADGLKEGKQSLIWGIVGMFIMASVFGILTVVLNTFGVDLPK